MKQYLALLLALSIAAAPAFAADSQYNGAWTAVAAKSSWSDGKFPKGFSLTIELRFGDGELVYHSVNDTRKDSLLVTDYTAKLDGKHYPFAGQARFNQIAVRRLNDHEFEILKLKDDDVIVGEFWQFSADGKQLVRRGVGKSPEGKSKAYEECFVRK